MVQMNKMCRRRDSVSDLGKTVGRPGSDVVYIGT